MQRVAVVGSPGSGKTTLARLLARSVGARHVELDALHHLPGWEPRPTDEFRALVADALSSPEWVVDGNYTSKVQDIVWTRADTVIVLDLARRTVVWRVVRRSVRRLAMREVLWNGNRESLRNLVSRDPERNIVLWTWRQHARYRSQYRAARSDARWSQISWVVLGSTREVRAFSLTFETNSP